MLWIKMDLFYYVDENKVVTSTDLQIFLYFINIFSNTKRISFQLMLRSDYCRDICLL